MSHAVASDSESRTGWRYSALLLVRVSSQELNGLRLMVHPLHLHRRAEVPSSPRASRLRFGREAVVASHGKQHSTAPPEMAGNRRNSGAPGPGPVGQPDAL